MNVLLSNDDGITSPGIRALYEVFRAGGHEVFAIAPMRQQSGVSHAITVFEPLRIERGMGEGIEGVGVYGTPADCVKLGLAELSPFVPDLVVAGINLGRNVGPDVFYSGTIGAAAEGAHGGIASMAFSHADPDAEMTELLACAEYGARLAEGIDWRAIRPGRVINVNFPSLPFAEMRGTRVCEQAPPVWKNGYIGRNDPRGWPYWWMAGEIETARVPPDSDMALLDAGYITITPLKFEHTDAEAMAALEKMDPAERG